jgi:hypothetical protein
MTDAHPRSLAAHVGATHALQQALPTCTEKGRVLARTSQPCRISSLSVYKDPASFAEALLLVDTWNDMVTEAVYQADLAGLSSHISVDADGIEVVVAGFSDRLPTLVSSLFQVGSVFDVCKSKYACFCFKGTETSQNFSCYPRQTFVLLDKALPSCSGYSLSDAVMDWMF